MPFAFLYASKRAQRSAVLLNFLGAVFGFSQNNHLWIAVSRSLIHCFQVEGVNYIQTVV